MASYDRRLLYYYYSPPPPPPPPPPAPPTDDDCPGTCSNLPPPPKSYPHRRGEISGIVIGAAVFFGVLYLVITRYFLKRRPGRSARRGTPGGSPPILFDTQEQFLDEEHGPQLDHPIWYIRTVGLDRTIIDSIAVVKYKAGDGLIEGTECSVCLGEFAEDESLRLLPKCSHAFHVQCIDTWLLSHKNCPLCRAPIVRAGGGAEVASPEVVANAVGSSSNAPVVEENSHHSVDSSSDLSPSRVEEVRAGEDGGDDITDLGELGNPKPRGRVVSDLGDQLRIAQKGNELMRRSVSVDSVSASEIYRAVAAMAARDQSRGSSTKQGSEMKSSSLIVSSNKMSSSGSSSSSSSSSLYKMMKSCSVGASRQREPRDCMKRSSSSIGNVRSVEQSSVGVRLVQ